jgi:hypothetical protein
MEVILFLSILAIPFIFPTSTNDISHANDVSELNETPIATTIDVTNKQTIINAINFANQHKMQISICGTKHSMGGQSIAKNSIRLDMLKYSKVLSLDIPNKIVTVESGITWAKLIVYLNQYGLTPQTLQSYSTFSVGGSISVNAHGITNDKTVGASVVEMEIAMADGKLVRCNRTNNSTLFSLVIGGYGLFGVITEVVLKIEPNASYEMEYLKTSVANFKQTYDDAKWNSCAIKMTKINIVNFDDVYCYMLYTKQTGIVSVLGNEPNQMSYLGQLLYKWALPIKSVQKFRYDLENATRKPLDVSSDIIERNQLLYESATPLANLVTIFVKLNQTHILQEFFVPDNAFLGWMAFLKQYFLVKHLREVVLLNISIRYVEKDENAYMKYAKQNVYAFVFYYRLNKTQSADAELAKIHFDLVNASIMFGGTFYLPYRHHYTKQQLLHCYPEIVQFMKLKKKYDVNNVFGNLWFDFITKN